MQPVMIRVSRVWVWFWVDVRARVKFSFYPCNTVLAQYTITSWYSVEMAEWNELVSDIVAIISVSTIVF